MWCVEGRENVDDVRGRHELEARVHVQQLELLVMKPSIAGDERDRMLFEDIDDRLLERI